MFINKSVGKKNQSISRKRGGFRMAFKLVRETIFEQTNKFFVIICFSFFLYIIKAHNEKVISFCFVVLIMLHM